MMNDMYVLREAKQARIEKGLELVNDAFESFNENCMLSEKSKDSIRLFIDCLELDVVERVMCDAGAKFDRNGPEIFNYFCGVCWNKIMEWSREGR